jgi:hypothetical protein
VAGRAAGAACPSTSSSLGEDTRAALQAYVELDVDGFRTLANDVVASVPCLTEPVTPDVAADVHVTYGLLKWLGEDADGTLAAFRGAVQAGRASLPDDLAPPGSRPRAIFDTARTLGGAVMIDLGGEQVRVDGVDGLGAVPSERAAVVQHAGTGGDLATWYLRPGFEGGAASVVAAVAARAAPEMAPPTLPSSRVAPANGARPSRTLAISGGVAGVVAGGLLGVAAWQKGGYLDV